MTQEADAYFAPLRAFARILTVEYVAILQFN